MWKRRKFELFKRLDKLRIQQCGLSVPVLKTIKTKFYCVVFMPLLSKLNDDEKWREDEAEEEECPYREYGCLAVPQRFLHFVLEMLQCLCFLHRHGIDHGYV